MILHRSIAEDFRKDFRVCRLRLGCTDMTQAVSLGESMLFKELLIQNRFYNFRDITMFIKVL